jgi:UDPglucose 6-dehydrogenase
MKKIGIIGAGYVGLVTGACFAQKNNQVIIVENNKKKISLLLDEKIPFYEPGLVELVQDGIKKGNIIFVEHVGEVLKKKPSILFSCVGTPSQEDGSADLSSVWIVAREIGLKLSEYCLVVNKSTVPVGTAAKVSQIIRKQIENRRVAIEFDIASNPEFLKEGNALQDFLYPDRVVVGTKSDKALRLLSELYKPFLRSKEQIVAMDIASAELTKYAANAMLATRISFMNQMALLADNVGADIERVKEGIAMDRRIGKHFLDAGIGYGGSCFPKDVKALIHTGKVYQQPMTLVKEVDSINILMQTKFIEKIMNFYCNNLEKKKIGIWGLAFKPETDDIRDAPSINVIKGLLNAGVKVYAYDPVAQKNAKKLFDDKITFMSSADDVLRKCDALVILTEWKEFVCCDVEKFGFLRDKVVFDARNCFSSEKIRSNNITYITIGRNIGTQKKKSFVRQESSKSREKTILL